MIEIIGATGHRVVDFAARWARRSFLSASLRPLFLTLSGCLVPGIASADQMMGSVTIMDFTPPITATVVGGTNGVNESVTADKATPEMLSFSIPVDGSVNAASGMAVFLEPSNNNIVSDLLTVTVTPKVRGNNIPYFDASGTFTSTDDPAGLMGIANNVIAKGIIETGLEQNIGAALVDPSNGNPIDIGGLTIMAASQVDEPAGVLLLAQGLLMLAMVLGLRRTPAGKAADLA